MRLAGEQICIEAVAENIVRIRATRAADFAIHGLHRPTLPPVSGQSYMLMSREHISGSVG